MEQAESKDIFRLVLESKARNLREQLDAAEAPLTAFLCRGESIPPETVREAVRRCKKAYEEIEEFERLTGVRV